MSRQTELKLVSSFYKFIFILIFSMEEATPCLAQNRFSTTTVNGDYLFWLVFFSLVFVQGAINGLSLLWMRTLQFDYAGQRWTEGFWLGFPLASVTFLFTHNMHTHIHQETPFFELGIFAISLWLILFMVLNIFGSYYIARWAAKE